MGAWGPWELLILAGVTFLLFGYKTLPSATRSLGRSLRVLKSEARGVRVEDDPTSATGQRRVIDGEISDPPERNAPDGGAGAGSWTG